MAMKQRPLYKFHYGTRAWTNPTTEAIRRDECLCWNCDNLKINEPDNCTIAEALYQIVKRDNLALMITRCPKWKPLTATTKKP